MFASIAEVLSSTHKYQPLPANVTRLGYFNTPFMVVTPHGTVINDSIIIYCHTLTETLEQALETAQIVSDICGVPTLCFEYCGFYSSSEYTKGNLLCVMLDVYQYVLTQYPSSSIYLIGNVEGCFPAIELVDICRRQKLELSGVILLNPSELKTSKYKVSKFRSCVMSSSSITLRGKAKKVAKKFERCQEVFFETKELNLFEAETDEVMRNIIQIIRMEMVDVKTMEKEFLTFEKPAMFKGPFELVNEFVNDEPLANFLLSYGYFDKEIICSMTHDEIESLPIDITQKEILKNVIEKSKKNSEVVESPSAPAASPQLPKTPAFVTVPIKESKFKGLSPLFTGRSIFSQSKRTLGVSSSISISEKKSDKSQKNIKKRSEVFRIKTPERAQRKSDEIIEVVLDDENEKVNKQKIHRTHFTTDADVMIL
ncbi:hypothetical protein EIN_096670 [Entamoeba invadens IP1]|uniref:Uncharacterized protein n=1 Tax=Entamoeba invadens IP1 TaxID=370355 RepID=A0A0A1U0J2_ENTIV|nr:hypothetical protein EIN_096670 [Entamoeba invadens IP1]ELP87400.1 hypothetical protein EIN_096670 [Entamoeba invadens IP1]|eukprot:XP_004254171.1 hypothetical protein EIN_096670 [Entamoeba invadens IP1]